MKKKIHSPKIHIIVERQWHIASHCKAMIFSGREFQLLGGFPLFRYLRLDIPRKNIRTFAFPAVWNLFVRRAGLPSGFSANAPKMLASWAKRFIESGDVVISYSNVYQHLFPRLPNCIRVIERGSMHPEDYFSQIELGYREANLPCDMMRPPDLEDELDASKLAHFISVGSNNVKEGYVRRGYDPSRIMVIPYGIDEKRFSFLQRTTPQTDQPLRMGIVGLLGVRKGLLRFCKILDWMGRRGMKVTGVLIGPLMPEGVKILEMFPQVSFEARGVLKGLDLVDALHSCHLYSLPSYEEGFPISLIEAMSTGLPGIVSSDTGGAEAIEHGVSGLVLKEFNDENFDSILFPFLKAPSWIGSASQAAGERVRNRYTLQHYFHQLRSEYDSMFSIITAAPEGLPSIGELMSSTVRS